MVEMLEHHLHHVNGTWSWLDLGSCLQGAGTRESNLIAVLAVELLQALSPVVSMGGILPPIPPGLMSSRNQGTSNSRRAKRRLCLGVCLLLPAYLHQISHGFGFAHIVDDLLQDTAVLTG